ncbi:hypothetical protein HDU96_007655 [Phlyctochytrium bullatum]|nr:hypothetical protein HDU96_007655 [Phlyctochytrium bullatum]
MHAITLLLALALATPALSRNVRGDGVLIQLRPIAAAPAAAPVLAAPPVYNAIADGLVNPTIVYPVLPTSTAAFHPDPEATSLASPDYDDDADIAVDHVTATSAVAAATETPAPPPVVVIDTATQVAATVLPEYDGGDGMYAPGVPVNVAAGVASASIPVANMYTAFPTTRPGVQNLVQSGAKGVAGMAVAVVVGAAVAGLFA